MRNFKSHIWPPNGYVFKDRDGFVHAGNNWAELEAKVMDYRARNKMEPGDVHEEITNQACAGVPSLCYDDNPVDMNFTQHVTAWLGHAAGYKRIGQWKRISDATAARRAAICAVCPKQRALSSACGACINSINGMRKALLDGQMPQHRGLSACLVTHEDCQSTVHIDLPPNPHPDLPAACWRRSR